MYSTRGRADWARSVFDIGYCDRTPSNSSYLNIRNFVAIALRFEVSRSPRIKPSYLAGRTALFTIFVL
ncbi:MAG: hypothetical protein V7L23_08005 [Nostoc sp.]|uniref:hypothetical protein n=1 Tax=Nostoc sp. TaxID=1180 RepID=UPI002FEF3F6D